LVIEDPSPSLSAHGFRDLGEICHSAAVWPVQFGIE